MSRSVDVVIAGCGIAGVSAAYFLSTNLGLRHILLVDPVPPLSLTTDHSTECYRNWWPGPDAGMVGLMNRSIDLLEELAMRSGNAFHLNRRGYLYVTADRDRLPGFIAAAQQVSKLGAGTLRMHSSQPGDPPYQPADPDGFSGQLDGADLLLDPDLIARTFPGVTSQAAAALHVRRAGWFSAQQLGAYLLEQAASFGVRVLNDRVAGVETRGGRVTGVRLASGETVSTRCFVNAAGPGFLQVGRMLGVELPVFAELHLKVAVQDALGVIDRQAPLLIWSDPQRLDWSAEEAEMLAEVPQLRPLLDELPAGVHTRPEGGPGSRMALMLWEYQTRLMEPVYPLPEIDPFHAEVVLRGLMRLLPGMSAYLNKLPRPRIDGGYYIKTRENRPLIGKLPVEGAYMIGALSGFGLMAACGAGELLAAQIGGAPLPAPLNGYAQTFALERYQDEEYLRGLGDGVEEGQL